MREIATDDVGYRTYAAKTRNNVLILQALRHRES